MPTTAFTTRNPATLTLTLALALHFSLAPSPVCPAAHADSPSCPSPIVLVDYRYASTEHIKAGWHGNLHQSPPKFYLTRTTVDIAADVVPQSYQFTRNLTTVEILDRLQYSYHVCTDPTHDHYGCGCVAGVHLTYQTTGAETEQAWSGTLSYSCTRTYTGQSATSCPNHPAWLDQRLAAMQTWGSFSAIDSVRSETESVHLEWFIPSSPTVTRTYTNTITSTLANEYTTQQLIQDLQSKSAAQLQSLPSSAWSRTPAHATLAIDNAIQRCASGTAVEFRFHIPHTDRDTVYRIQWAEITRPTQGQPSIRYAEETLHGTGTNAIGQTHLLPPPDANGTRAVERVQIQAVPTTHHPSSSHPPAATDNQAPHAVLGGIPGGTGCNSCGGTGLNPHSAGAFFFALNLGQGIRGPIGHIVLANSQPGPWLTSASHLQLTTPSSEAELIKNGNSLQQIKIPQGLIRVVQISDRKLELQLFPTGRVLPKLNGLYPTTGNPSASWTLDTPDPNSLLQIRLTETRPAQTWRFTYQYSTADQSWALVDPAPAAIHSSLVTFAPDGSATHTTLTKLPDGSTLQREDRTYQTFPWGTALTRLSLGEGPAQRITQYRYLDTGFNPASQPSGSHLPLERVLHPDGSWQRYVYLPNDPLGRIHKVIRPFGSLPPDAPETQCHVTEFSYSPLGNGDDGSLNPYTPRTEIVRIASKEIARTYATLSPTASHFIRAHRPGALHTDPLNLTEITAYHTDTTHIRRPKSRRLADGTFEFFSHSESSSGRTVTTTRGQPNAGQTAILNGTQTVTSHNALGFLNQSTTRRIVQGAPTHTLEQITTSIPDEFGRPTRTAYLDSSYDETQFACCGPHIVTDRDGIPTTHLLDSLKRSTGTSRLGIQQTVVLDPAGRVIAQLRIGTDSSSIRLAGFNYNAADELIAQTNALDGITTHSETLGAHGGLVRTTTLPNNATRIETYERDGSLRSLTGTATSPTRFETTLEIDNNTQVRVTREIKLNANGSDSFEWVKHYSDALGRTYKTVYSAPASPYPTALRGFDSLGHPLTDQDPDGVITRYQYDAEGRLEYTAVDLNRNGAIDFAGADVIHQTITDFTSRDNLPVQRTRSYSWSTPDLNTPTLTRTVETTLDGLATWTTVADAVWKQTVTRNRTAGTRTLIETDPANTSTVRIYQGDSLIALTRLDSAQNQTSRIDYEYDPHGRLIRELDARGHETRHAFNNADLETSTTTPAPGDGSPAQITLLQFNPALELTHLTLPDASVQAFEYNPHGHLTLQSGSQLVPTRHAYDHHGRLTSLTTWSSFPALTQPRTTTWNYDPHRGWLANKRYPDGTGPDFTYTPAGRPKTRLWARLNPQGIRLTTTYTHDPAGRLESVAYNDTTPSVTQTYDRQNRPRSLTRSGITLTLDYHPSGQPTAEIWSGDYMHAAYTSWSLDTALRPKNFAAAIANAGIASATLGYDPASRLQSVLSGTQSATYHYLANSHLIEQIVFRQGNNVAATTVRSYDALDRLESMTTTPANSQPIGVQYRHDTLNRRNRSDFLDGSSWTYGYDSLGQLASGRHSWAPNRPTPGWQFAYTHDHSGNRTRTDSGGDASGLNLRLAAYTPNSLNHYTARTSPGTLDILGATHAAATVTVNNQPAQRFNELFHATVTANNSAGPALASLTIQSTRPAAFASRAGSTLVPAAAETFTHDLDGNLIADSLHTYTYDAENRLVTLQSQPAVPTPARYRLEFSYDPHGRRLRKRSFAWNTSTASYQLATETRYLYDGWNLIAESDAYNTVLATYTWGLDLSGSPQGAGGIGGLLWQSPRNHPAHFPSLDANGNILALINSATGEPAALYTHGPFAEPLRVQSPPFPDPFRFSTKYTDPESNLIYYGLRFYNPSTGHWLTRDPIGETGGINLYAFVGNDPVNTVDPVGLFLTAYHIRITRTALATVKLADRCIDTIINANIGQDKGALMKRPPFTDPRNHGDNSLLADTITRLQGWINQAAGRSCGGCGGIDTALEAFGKASHALQDLYAHSTYIESFADEASGVPAVPLWPLLRPDGRPNVPPGVVSGIYPDIPGNPNSHLILNKDSPTSLRGADRNARVLRYFDLAEGAATRHTRKLWDEFVMKLSPSQVQYLWKCCK